MSHIYIWLGLGVLFLTLEAFGVTGVGLLFAGLGALVVGGLLQFGAIDEANLILQFLVFFGSTVLWAALLWKPLKNFSLKNRPAGYSNMVGDVAYIGATGLQKGAVGEATWSGTIMKAELAQGTAVESLPAGAQVIITEVKGNTLVVKPK